MNKIITLNATGETIEFLEVSNEKIELLVTSPAGVEGFPIHKHPLQREKLEAIEGKVGLTVESKTMILETGQTFTVPASTFHQYFSPEKTTIKFKSTFQPPLNTEYLLTEMFTSANFRNSKDPSMFDACFILSQAKGEYYVRNIPIFIQKILFPLIAYLGKIFGLVKAKALP